MTGIAATRRHRQKVETAFGGHGHHNANAGTLRWCGSRPVGAHSGQTQRTTDSLRSVTPRPPPEPLATGVGRLLAGRRQTHVDRPATDAASVLLPAVRGHSPLRVACQGAHPGSKRVGAGDIEKRH